MAIRSSKIKNDLSRNKKKRDLCCRGSPPKFNPKSLDCAWKPKRPEVALERRIWFIILKLWTSRASKVVFVVGKHGDGCCGNAGSKQKRNISIISLARFVTPG